MDAERLVKILRDNIPAGRSPRRLELIPGKKMKRKKRKKKKKKELPITRREKMCFC